MARPKAVIDFERVDKLLKAQCTGASIAGILGVHPDTLYRAIEETSGIPYSEYKQLKRAEGKEILREKMYEMAIGGNVVMQIWLSKQYLGMSETLEKLTDEGAELIIEKLKSKYNATGSNQPN